MNGQRLQVVNTLAFTILEALSPEQCTLMLRLLLELPKPACYLADFLEMFGGEMYGESVKGGGTCICMSDMDGISTSC